MNPTYIYILKDSRFKKQLKVERLQSRDRKQRNPIKKVKILRGSRKTGARRALAMRCWPASERDEKFGVRMKHLIPAVHPIGD